jgi:hypothetical protein
MPSFIYLYFSEGLGNMSHGDRSSPFLSPTRAAIIRSMADDAGALNRCEVQNYGREVNCRRFHQSKKRAYYCINLCIILIYTYSICNKFMAEQT